MVSVGRLTEKVTVIASSPHTFHGAGMNKHRVLHELCKRGYDIRFIGLRKPFFLKRAQHRSFKAFKVTHPPSEAYGHCGKLFWGMHAIAEEAASQGIEAISTGQKVILWGTYLFPFVQSLKIAKEIIYQSTGNIVPLISFPAGSDIWESGVRLKHSVRSLLVSPDINCRATYSEQFATEIQETFHVDLPFFILPPLVSADTFHPLPDSQKVLRRTQLGIPPDAVVFIHHSNLRPVKRPQDVVTFIEHLQEKTDKQVVLLMLGPMTDTSTRDQHQLSAEHPLGKPQHHRQLLVYSVGLVPDVEKFLSISDFAVNLSVHDSFNISLFEAVLTECVCVTSVFPAITQLFQSWRTGVIVPTKNIYRGYSTSELISLPQTPFDFEAVLDGLVALVNDPNRRSEIAKTSRKAFVEELRFDRVLDKYESMIGSLVGRS